MQVYVDADGCPVVDITVKLCRETGIHCYLMCDTAHCMEKEGAETMVFDQGADSVDYAIAARVSAGDIVITQDYGLAAMCLAKGAQVLHQDGWAYTEYNIEALLLQRHESRKYRAGGGRIKGPSKRKIAQDAAFRKALQTLLQGNPAGGC